MNFLKYFFTCLLCSIRNKYIYTINAKLNYTGDEKDSIPLYGTVCLGKTSNSSTDAFISYPVLSFTMYCDGQTLTGNSGNLRFHQHSPNKYHNEGYQFTSSDGNFSFGNDDVGTINDMTFPTPPMFIDFANGGSGTLNGQQTYVNAVKLVRVKYCPC